MGWYTPELTTVDTRLQGAGFWAIFSFVLNALIFGLVGLQLRPILDQLHGLSWEQLLGYAALLWGCRRRRQVRVRVPDRVRSTLALGRPSRTGSHAALAIHRVRRWAGMRGGVTLAAALAIPLETDAGVPFRIAR
jgi:CPA1 family monovalent cation:H+ antiporter